MKSNREIQEELQALGAVDNFSRPLVPMKIYDYAYANNVSDAVLDGALGWRMGTSTLWVIAHGMAHLTGETAGDVRPVQPGSVFGSGFEGTQAPEAPPAVPNVAPAPEVTFTDDERKAVWRLCAVQIGGWVLPDDAAVAFKYVRKLRMPDLKADEVERWESLPAGTVGT